MQEFLHISLSFPTVIFTVLLGFAVLFSLLSVIGGVGADFLDLDFDVSGVDEAGLSLFQVLSSFGVGKVPMSIFAAAYVFCGWALSYLAVTLFSDLVAAHIVVSFGILIAVTLVALPVSGLLLAPLTALLESDSGATTGEGLVGEVCTISSGRVDEGLGRARCYVDKTELILSVRCTHENDLTRGKEALIIDYDEAENTYLVESVEAIMSDDLPEDVREAGTILDELDFEALEQSKERHREEKKEVETREVHNASVN